MMGVTTIQLQKDIVKELNNNKEYPRQTYNELIRKMLQIFQNIKENNQYDEFLHKIQQPKMKELWDNPDDEDWERA